MTNEDRNEIRQIIREELNARLGNATFATIGAPLGQGFSFVAACNHQWAYNPTSNEWTCINCHAVSNVDPTFFSASANVKLAGR